MYIPVIGKVALIVIDNAHLIPVKPLPVHKSIHFAMKVIVRNINGLMKWYIQWDYIVCILTMLLSRCLIAFLANDMPSISK